jgi:hypothetical protein
MCDTYILFLYGTKQLLSVRQFDPITACPYTEK